MAEQLLFLSMFFGFCMANLLVTALGIVIKRDPESLLYIGSKMLYRVFLKHS